MRVPMKLRYMAYSKQQTKRMNELDRVVRQIVTPEPGKPETFYATSGTSSIETAGAPWMPHHYRPTVGFAPNGPTAHV